MSDLVSEIRRYFHLDANEDVIRSSTGRVVDNEPSASGYISATFGNSPRRRMKLHRIKFALLHGYLPEQVDHKNRKRSDNSSVNLRASDKTTNKWNTTKRRTNSGLPVGVVKVPSGRYRANVSHYRVRIYLGTFDTPEEASHAYQKYCSEKRGDFHAQMA